VKKPTAHASFVASASLGEAVDKLAVAFATTQRAIERLERARIVKRMGDTKRDRVYAQARS
jgi:DNA-binding transcriptional regulator YhcF (GntR family)